MIGPQRQNPGAAAGNLERTTDARLVEIDG
jgi:hypothetical protein